MPTPPFINQPCINREWKLTTQVQDGSSKIPVGQIIAILAEEGDDLSSIEVPKDLGPEGSSTPSASTSESEKKEEAAPKKEESKKEQKASTPEPTAASDGNGNGHGHGHKEVKHPKPLFPSVSRL